MSALRWIQEHTQRKRERLAREASRALSAMIEADPALKAARDRGEYFLFEDDAAGMAVFISFKPAGKGQRNGY